MSASTMAKVPKMMFWRESSSFSVPVVVCEVEVGAMDVVLRAKGIDAEVEVGVDAGDVVEARVVIIEALCFGEVELYTEWLAWEESCCEEQNQNHGFGEGIYILYLRDARLLCRHNSASRFRSSAGLEELDISALAIRRRCDGNISPARTRFGWVVRQRSRSST